MYTDKEYVNALKSEVDCVFALNLLSGIIRRASKKYDDFPALLQEVEGFYEMTVKEALELLSNSLLTH